MNAQVRNRCGFSSYLDIKNAKKILFKSPFFKRDFVTQTYDFTSRQDSIFSAAVSEQGMDRRVMTGTPIKSFLKILR